MSKEIKFGLIMQSSGVGSVLGGSGSKHSLGGHSYPKCIDGRKVYGIVEKDDKIFKNTIYISDKIDNERLNKLNLDGSDPDDIYRAGRLLQTYDEEASANLISIAVELGSIEACLLIGRAAFNCVDTNLLRAGKSCLENAANDGYTCGKCWLGRYYAEGKGCKKNKVLAKKWLNKAAFICSEAEGYLDQYGLR